MFSIFDKLGGEESAIAALRSAAGKPGWPSGATLKLWRVNREIPGKAVTLLMEICDARGIAYSAADFRAAEPARSEAAE